MKTRAYSKINLSLDVTGIEENGYHNLEMIMVPLDFYDVVEINKSEDMVYNCLNRKLYFDNNNTIVKAINLMKEEFNIKDNFVVELQKHIPIKAGLAGGSSDGAAVIRLINNMYNLRLNKEQIKELCMKIGSDVLFCYYSKPAIVSGIGDEIKFIDIKDDYYVLIVKPKAGVSTKECYDSLDLDCCVHPNTELIVSRLKNGEEVTDLLINNLEEPSIRLCNDIAKVKDELKKAGACFSLVTGSGSSVFTLSKSKQEIEDLRNRLLNKGFFIRSTIIKNAKI